MDQTQQDLVTAGAAASEEVTAVAAPPATIESDASTKPSSEQDVMIDNGDSSEPAVESQGLSGPASVPEIINLPRDSTPYALRGGEVTEVSPETFQAIQTFRDPGHPLTYARRESSSGPDVVLGQSDPPRGMVSRIVQIARLLNILAETGHDVFSRGTTEELPGDNDLDRSQAQTLFISSLQNNDEVEQNDEEASQARRELVAHIANSGRLILIDIEMLLDALFSRRTAEVRQVEEVAEGSSVDKSGEGGETPKKKKKKSKKKSKKANKEINLSTDLQHECEEEEAQGLPSPSESLSSGKGKGKAKEEHHPAQDDDLEIDGESPPTIVSESHKSEKAMGATEQRFQDLHFIEDQHQAGERDRASNSSSKSSKKAKQRAKKAIQQGKEPHPQDDRNDDKDWERVSESPDSENEIKTTVQQTYDVHPAEEDHHEEGGKASASVSALPELGKVEILAKQEEQEEEEFEPAENQHLDEIERERPLTSSSKNPMAKKRKGRAKRRGREPGITVGQLLEPKQKKTPAIFSKAKWKKGIANSNKSGDENKTAEDNHLENVDDVVIKSFDSKLDDGKQMPKSSGKEPHITEYQPHKKEREGVLSSSFEPNFKNDDGKSEGPDKKTQAIQGQHIKEGGEKAAAAAFELPKQSKKKNWGKKEKKLRPRQEQHKDQPVEEHDGKAPTPLAESSKIMDIETPLAGLDQVSAAILRAIDPRAETTPDFAEGSSVHNDFPNTFSSTAVSQEAADAPDGNEVEITGQGNFQDALEELGPELDFSQAGNSPKLPDNDAYTKSEIVSQTSEGHGPEQNQLGEGRPANEAVLDPTISDRLVIHKGENDFSVDDSWGLTEQERLNALHKRTKSLTEFEGYEFIVGKTQRLFELVNGKTVKTLVQTDQAGIFDEDIGNSRSANVKFLRERTVSRASPSEKVPSTILRRDSAVRPQDPVLNSPEVENLSSELGQGSRKDKEITAIEGPKIRMNPLAKEFVPASQTKASAATNASSIHHTGVNQGQQGEKNLGVYNRGGTSEQTTKDANTRKKGAKRNTTRTPQNIPLQPRSPSSQLTHSQYHDNLINKKKESTTAPEQSTAIKHPNTARSFDESQGHQPIEWEAVLEEQSKPPNTEGNLITSVKSIPVDSVASQSDVTDQPHNPIEASPSTVRSDSTMGDQGENTSPNESQEQKVIKFADVEFKCGWCEKRVAIDDKTVLLCYGCGPFSPTRYCTDQHLIYHMAAHWELCNGVSFPFPVDPKSMPSHYIEYCPAIEDRHGMFNYWRHRQRAWSMYRHDQADYVLFYDLRQGNKAGFPVKTIIPTHAVIWEDGAKTKDVFNRLLNLCFYDHTLIRPLLLLYRLIRWVLQDHDEWNAELEDELSSQFWAEFRIDARSMTNDEDEDEDIMDEWFGENDQNGVESIVKYHEDRNPILRYWRREHPDRSLTGWDRFSGKGFPDAEPVDRQHGGFSAGWEGYQRDARLWQGPTPAQAA